MVSRLEGWLRRTTAQGWVLALERSRDPSAYLVLRRKGIDHNVVTALAEASYGFADIGDAKNAVKWVDLAAEASLLGGTAQSQADVFLCRSIVSLKIAGTRPQQQVPAGAEPGPDVRARLREALEAAGRALTLYRKAGLADRVPVVLHQMAAVQEASGERILALQSQIECAIAWSQVPHAPDPPAAVPANVANRYWELTDEEHAAGGALLSEYSQAILTATASWTEGAGLAGLRDALGDACHTAGKAEEALGHWERAAAIYQRLGRSADEFLACRRIQVTSYALGRYENARQHGERCAALSRAVADPADAAECLHDLALTYYQFSLADLASETYRNAIGLFQQSETPAAGAADCLLELGFLEIANGQPEAARADLEQMLRLPLTRLHGWTARATLAQLCMRESSDLDAAIRYAGEAVECSVQDMSQAVRAESLRLSGTAYFAAGDAAKALDLFRRLIEIAPASAEPEQLAVSAYFRYNVTPPTLSQATFLAFKAAQAAGPLEESARYFILHWQAAERDAGGQFPGTGGGAASVVTAVQALVTSRTEDERREAFEREQALLLTVDADQVLGRLTVRAREAGDDRIAGLVQELRALLFEARVIGIPSAWGKFQAGRERALRAAREEEQRQAAARRAAEAALEEPEKEMSEEERLALWEKYGTSNVKIIYDTDPSADGGLSWVLIGSGQERQFRATSVESWLLLTSFRDQRRFLENHLELLGPESTAHIDQLRIALRRSAAVLLVAAGEPPGDIAEALRDLQAHAEVLEDARSRGGTGQAVREAYVNAHGGFAADVPLWVEDMLARLAHLTATGTGIGAQDSREALLREAVTRAEQDSGVAPETLAEFRNELGRALARHLPDSRLLAAAGVLHRQALEAFGQERYPRQWLRTGVLNAAVEDELARLEAASPERWHAQRVDELMAQGTTHQEAEAWALAALCFARVTRLAPDHATAWLGLAKAYQQLNFSADALAACETAVRHAPGHADAWAVVGTLQAQQKQFADALSAYQSAVALNPGDAYLWIQIAETLKSLQRPEEALAAYERVLSIDHPTHPVIWHNKGSLLDGLERYEEALAAYDRALALAPALFPALVNKGNTLLRLNRYEESLAAFDEALRQAAQFYPAWHGRGMALLCLQRYHEALSALEGALMLNSSDAGIWSNLAAALAALGRETESSYARRRAEALNSQPG